MAQSDYELAAHISGLNQRTEINSIFDSILTHNSGSTAPTVTKAFMMWVDTSNATYYYLKMRNHDNTAWVTLFIYTVSTKVITPFIINSPTTNAIPKINADGTIGNSNIINDANGNVGFGVTPSAWVDDKAIQLPQGSISSGYEYGLSSVVNAYRTSGNIWKYNVSQAASRYNMNIDRHQWQTAPSGTAGNAIAWTNAMTLNANGNLLVGTSTDNGVDKLQVNGSISSGRVSMVYDLSTITNAGGFLTGDFAFSLAANRPCDYGTLHQIARNEVECTQMVQDMLSNRLFVRRYVNSAWSAWHEK